MVKVIERDWDYTEAPNEKKDKLYSALQNSLGGVGGILVLDLVDVISIDYGNIELLPQHGAIAVYPVDPTGQYKPVDSHKHYPHFSLAERVAAIYERETGEEAVIYKFRTRVRWAEGAVLEELKKKKSRGKNGT